MKEIWKDIFGFEKHYQVSTRGRVRSIKTRHYIREILKYLPDRYGYARVALCKHNRASYKNVARLVANAFIPNPQNLETVNHKDENKVNNRADNLEWMSRGDNVRCYYRNRHYPYLIGGVR